MATKGIVVVNPNYRLNIFGFLAHPELSSEAPYNASGNYGLLDQLAALRWVHENIAAFGGDPDKVTIAGESAGSVSVSMQMASPLSKDLIRSAIGESGAGINPTLAPVPLAEAEKIGQKFVEKAGFPTFSKFRSLSTRDIYEIYNESGKFGFPPVIDGYFLPKSLPDVFNSGEQAQVPLLLGWNSAEITGMGFMQGKPYNEENYLEKVKQTYNCIRMGQKPKLKFQQQPLLQTGLFPIVRGNGSICIEKTATSQYTVTYIVNCVHLWSTRTGLRD
jgi:para-nitrobenzyl esterase